MATINKVILVGNICRDPDARAFPDGKPLTELSIATNERWSNKETGERGETPEYHRVICTGQPADFAAKHLHKGNCVYIEGKLKSRKWTDAQGIERTGTEIRVDVITPVGARREMTSDNIG